MVQIRNHSLDGLKFVLILGVMVLHTIEPHLSIPWLKSIYLVCYIITIPTFVMISGYVSKGLSYVKWKQFAPNLLGSLLTFQILFIILFWFTRGRKPIEDFNFFFYNVLLIPEYVLWFLLSLVSWRLLYSLFHKNMSAPVLFGAAILAMILFSFLPFDQKVLSLGRTVYYFPFFVTGAIINQNSLLKIYNSSNWLYSLLLLNLLFFIPNIYTYPDIQRIVYGSYALNNLKEPVELNILMRLLVLLTSITNALVFLKFSKRLEWLSKEGKHTLTYYLFHAVFLITANYLLRFFNVLDIKLQIPLLFVTNVCFCLALSRYSKINYLLNPFSLLKKV